MRKNVSSIWHITLVAGAMLSVSVTGVLAQQQQPPRPTPFSEESVPGTQPPRVMVQGDSPATEATTTLTPTENERAAAERAARAKAFVSPRVVPFNVTQVAVECNGNCASITLQNACGLGRTPIAVDCVSVRDWNPGTSCGGANGRCASFPIAPTDFLSWYCDDTGGWDANVYCAQ
jgi:hypothetical protein